jgi:hypothetical protein
MKYFWLQQDPDFIYAPVIVEAVGKISRRDITPEYAHKIADITTFSVAGKGEVDFLDLLSKPFFLVSPLLKDTISMYLPKLSFKRVILKNRVQNIHQMYFLPIFAAVDCLSEKSVMTPDQSITRHLVLKKDALGEKAIFQVRHSRQILIIARLDAAESILRRRFRGIRLSQVDID